MKIRGLLRNNNGLWLWLLRIKRTLDGAEIDGLISDLQARKALAVERGRRADWRKREASNTFQLESDPDVALPFAQN